MLNSVSSSNPVIRLHIALEHDALERVCKTWEEQGTSSLAYHTLKGVIATRQALKPLESTTTYVLGAGSTACPNRMNRHPSHWTDASLLGVVIGNGLVGSLSIAMGACLGAVVGSLTGLRGAVATGNLMQGGARMKHEVTARAADGAVVLGQFAVNQVYYAYLNPPLALTTGLLAAVPKILGDLAGAAGGACLGMVAGAQPASPRQRCDAAFASGAGALRGMLKAGCDDLMLAALLYAPSIILGSPFDGLWGGTAAPITWNDRLTAARHTAVHFARGTTEVLLTPAVVLGTAAYAAVTGKPVEVDIDAWQKGYLSSEHYRISQAQDGLV